MGAKLGSGGGPMADINVTPLIDVVLVLLVVFMVVTPMLSSGLPVDLPQATTTLTVKDVGQFVTISVTEDGRWGVEQIVVEGEGEERHAMLLSLVYDEINRDPESAPTKPIIIKADLDLKYGQVRELIDVLAKKNLGPRIRLAASKEK